MNLVLHLIAVWLCRDVLRRILPPRTADIGAFVFALHPLQAEAVNYVWARATLLMAVFALLSVRDWLRGRVLLSVLWCALALASKEEAVGLPLFFTLLHFSMRRDRRELPAIAGMFLLAAVAGGLTLWAANTTAGSQAGGQSTFGPMLYLASEGLVLLRYLQLFVFPWGFTIDPAIPTAYWWAWIGVVVLLAIAARWFRHAGPGFWFIAGIVLLLPTSSVFPANDLAADRRVYLPLFCFGACAGFLLQRLRRRWLIALAILLAMLSAWRTWVWMDNARLWTEAVDRAPAKTRPRIQLARSVPPAEAEGVLLEAKKIAPRDASVASELGRTYLALNRPAEALTEFGTALALAPDNADAISNRGVALALLKQTDAAMSDFQRALEKDPCSFEARLNLMRMTGVRTEPSRACRYTPEQQAALDGR